MDRKRLILELARDFSAAEFLSKVYQQAGHDPPKFCGDELIRIWKEIQQHKLTWLERQVVYGRIEVVT